MDHPPPEAATVQAGQKRKIEELAEDDAPAQSDQQRSADEEQDGWQVAQSKSSKKRKKVPKSESHKYPSIKHSPNARLQSTVKLSDLQRLALYILDEVPAPNWVAVENVKHIRKVVAVMVPGLEAGLFTGNIALDAGAQQDEAHTTGDQAEHAQQETVAQHSSKQNLSISPDEYYPVRLESEKLPEPLKAFADMFPHIWPIRASGDEKYGKVQSPLETMLNTPLPKSKDQKNEKKETAKVQNVRTPITKYLVTLDELLEDVPMEWTIHPAMFPTSEEKAIALSKRELDGHTAAEGWVDTRVEKMEDGDVPDKDIQQGSLTAGRKILSMDCEMCRAANNKYVLTRVSVVDWDGNVVMDELVKPDEPIEDYLTQFSGITEEMLRDVTNTLPDIQKRLVEIVTPQTILMGHSLNSDLNALKITHPFVVDTAFLYPHPRGPPLKSSLKWLTQKYLSRSIQQGHGSSGHDSVEDARAVLDLVKLKCEKGPKWGTNDANVESIFKRLARCVRTKTQSVTGAEEHRVGALVDWGDPRRGYGSSAQVVFGCETDQDVAKNVVKAVNGPDRFDDDAPGVPVKGCDFVWARMRELEAVRGWWQAGKAPAVEPLRQRAMANNGMTNENEDDGENKTSKGETSEAEADQQQQPSAAVLATAVSRTAANLKYIYDNLPPCTALIVYSGTGDPHDSNRLQAMKRQFRKEYQTKKWDEIDVKWTDTEDQALRQAQKKLMRGCGFITVK
ncbi:exonuclease [Phyllosticta citrichinensis]|uniref:Exonuclease n=1 Tax=Phyllosticta citrichinensis TaxID=1130410 RepID=A0ABR1Y254_9PEZI